jgi:glycosyltransferase involved in cell wall biosynthesis
MSSPYQILKKLHRKLRTSLKDKLRPEISQRKVRSFIRSKQGLSAPNFSLANNPSLAIVIPCYGHAPFLKEMFESIRLQTTSPNQVIFVVDDSPDDTLQILEGLVRHYANEMTAQLIILENEKNLGQAASLNKAIEYSNTDLIMILNDDDYLMHDSIEVVLAILTRFPGTALLGGHSLHFGDDDLKSLPKLIKSICPVGNIEIDLRPPELVATYQKYNDINMTHSGSCFFKSAWKIIGGYYPEKTQRLVHFSDRDFQLRMNALFPVALSNVTPLSCWRNDSSVDQGVNS